MQADRHAVNDMPPYFPDGSQGRFLSYQKKIEWNFEFSIVTDILSRSSIPIMDDQDDATEPDKKAIPLVAIAGVCCTIPAAAFGLPGILAVVGGFSLWKLIRIFRR